MATLIPSPSPACAPREICIFWYHKGSCRAGDQCGLAHEDHPTWPMRAPMGYRHNYACQRPLCPLKHGMDIVRDKGRKERERTEQMPSGNYMPFGMGSSGCSKNVSAIRDEEEIVDGREACRNAIVDDEPGEEPGYIPFKEVEQTQVVETSSASRLTLPSFPLEVDQEGSSYASETPAPQELGSESKLGGTAISRTSYLTSKREKNRQRQQMRKERRKRCGSSLASNSEPFSIKVKGPFTLKAPTHTHSKRCLIPTQFDLRTPDTVGCHPPYKQHPVISRLQLPATSFEPHSAPTAPRSHKYTNPFNKICFYWYHKGYCQTTRTQRDGRRYHCRYVHHLDGPVTGVACAPQLDHDRWCGKPLYPVTMAAQKRDALKQAEVEGQQKIAVLAYLEKLNEEVVAGYAADYELPERNDRAEWDTDYLRRLLGDNM